MVFRLFPKAKMTMREKHFGSIQDIKAARTAQWMNNTQYRGLQSTAESGEKKQDDSAPTVWEYLEGDSW